MDIGEIMREYSKNKLDAEYEAERRLARARRDIADFARLTDEKNALKVNELRAKLSGKSRDISEELGQYDVRISACLKNAGVNPMEFLPRYTCKLCKDTGMVGADYCKCLYEKLYVNFYGALDIKSLKGSFEEFDVKMYAQDGAKPTPRDKAEGALKILKTFALQYPSTQKTGLVLLGRAGLGKSFSMASLAKEIIKKTPKVCYIRSFELFESFHAHRLNRGSSLKPLYDCDVVFIDDLGTEPVTGNVTREYLFAYLDMRISAGKHFVIASNLTDAQLMAHYGERVGSRIFAYEHSYKISFTGEDIRLK